MPRGAGLPDNGRAWLYATARRRKNLAQHKLMGRMEVLKVVSSHLTSRRGVLDRFVVEIRNNIIIKVNGRITVQYSDPKRSFPRSGIGLEQVGPATVIESRRVDVKEM
jgi:hypothetical protein